MERKSPRIMIEVQSRLSIFETKGGNSTVMSQGEGFRGLGENEKNRGSPSTINNERTAHR